MSALQSLEPGDIRARAEAWYARQIDRAAHAHGTRWPEHREWVDAYLREELRERLHALGWRPTA